MTPYRVFACLGSLFGLEFFFNPHTPLPGKPMRHLLDAPVTTFCRCRGFGEGCQDAARDPALGRRRVVAGRLVHQAHVLLVDGEDLDHLTLAHTDFVLLQCIVIFDHGHGRSPVAASQVTLLGDRARGTQIQEGWFAGACWASYCVLKAKPPTSRVNNRQNIILSNDIIFINTLLLHTTYNQG